MSFFVLIMFCGLGGLVLMAIPGVRRHGHVGHGGGGKVSAARGSSALRGAARTAGARTSGHAVKTAHASSASHGLSRFVPEPRALLSVAALYGACGNALENAAHLSFLPAAVLALIPALAIERLAVTPVWNLALRFQGKPSSSLGALVLEEAHAVTPFKNGKGLVRVVRDGRAVQLAARLIAEQSNVSVKVGDRLRIADVEPGTERVTVSLF